jgi:formylmethanofuran dehydrogenase subunit E
MTKAESFAYYHNTPLEDLFFVKETTLTLPEEARIFQSVVCDGCGEIAAENHIRLKNGKKLCRDCYQEYSRFHI